MKTDDEILASIMRRMCSDPHGCVIVEERIALFDSSWFDVSPEERDAIRRAIPPDL